MHNLFFVVVPRQPHPLCPSRRKRDRLSPPGEGEITSPLPSVAPPQLVLKEKKHRCRISDLSWCGPDKVGIPPTKAEESARFSRVAATRPARPEGK